jgi:hypothetical protein
VKGHTVALALIAWTLVVYEPGKSNPWIKAGFPTKDACEKQAAATRARLEQQAKANGQQARAPECIEGLKGLPRSHP